MPAPLALCVLLAASCSPAPPAPGAFASRATAPAADVPALVDEERAILSLLVGRECACGSRWSVLDETIAARVTEAGIVDPPEGIPEEWPWWGLAEGKPVACPVTQPMASALVEAGRETLALVPDLDPPCSVDVITRAEIERLREGHTGDTWLKTLWEERGTLGYIAFSPVVFDAPRRRALVVRGWYCSPHAAAEDVILLEKSGDAWTHVAEKPLYRE